jgi:hypothetical protein
MYVLSFLIYDSNFDSHTENFRTEIFVIRKQVNMSYVSNILTSVLFFFYLVTPFQLRGIYTAKWQKNFYGELEIL